LPMTGLGHKQTSLGAIGMSALCHNRTSENSKPSRSFVIHEVQAERHQRKPRSVALRLQQWKALGRGFNPAEGLPILKSFGAS
jgi:hypothetical protein